MAARLIKAMLVLAVVVLASPVAADEIQQRLRERVEAASPVIRGESVRALAALRRFCRTRDYRPAWTGSGAGSPFAALLAAVSRVEEHGLSPADYHLAPLQALAAGGDVVERELLAADSYLTLAAHLLEGRVDPTSVEPDWTANRRERDLVAHLGQALAEKRIGPSLQELEPVAPGYQVLKQALAMHREAAMTVGLAFGLQEIFANLVSGIIILFERPIRVGDVVTVGNVSGTVSRIRIRATTITDFDRKELIVPNKHFITQQVLNWTLSDAIIRVTFPISVSRGSEVERVKGILMDLANLHDMVLKEPEPSVIFKGFGPGALQFDLRVFIRREDYALVLDALNTAIEEGLKKADIEIAVDRQEIQVRSARDEPVRKATLPYESEPDEK